jgi:methionine aminotransferase
LQQIFNTDQGSQFTRSRRGVPALPVASKLPQMGKFYQAKRDRFCSLLAGSRFHFTPAAGTYFQLLDYSAISDETDVELATRLTREHKIAAIPISVFYAEPPPTRLLRFCFAKHDDTLARAAEILCSL